MKMIQKLHYFKFNEVIRWQVKHNAEQAENTVKK